MSYNTKNPLYGVRVGSTISSLDGDFDAVVLNTPRSLIIAQQESHKTLSGSSNYTHSSRMNQGSIGIAGSFGNKLSGKFKTAVSFYHGKASANSFNKTTVDYMAFSVGGVEYINLEELTVSELLTSLNAGCQQAALDVLDAYNRLVSKIETNNLDLKSVLGDDQHPDHQDVVDLLEDWTALSNKFTRDFNDGLVVGVVWGAYGGVEMTITDDESDNSWKGGIHAQFSASGFGGSVSVKGTAQWAGRNASAKVEVDCTSYVNGNVLKQQIDTWFNQVSNKSFSELADVKVMDRAPDLTIEPPTVPDFVKPSPDDVVNIQDKLANAKSLKDIQTINRMSLYLKEKKRKEAIEHSGGNTSYIYTIAAFEADLNKRADVDLVKQVANSIANNEVK